jgi:hypothetical protein
VAREAPACGARRDGRMTTSDVAERPVALGGGVGVPEATNRA